MEQEGIHPISPDEESMTGIISTLEERVADVMSAQVDIIATLFGVCIMNIGKVESNQLGLLVLSGLASIRSAA